MQYHLNNMWGKKINDKLFLNYREMHLARRVSPGIEISVLCPSGLYESCWKTRAHASFLPTLVMGVTGTG